MKESWMYLLPPGLHIALLGGALLGLLLLELLP
jgi:hypothetical protein